MTAVPTFCFVIPCFNEEDNVWATIAGFGCSQRDHHDEEYSAGPNSKTTVVRLHD
jgi:hypothetical protein